MSLAFSPTHRILIAATSGNHGYDMTEIDVNNGTFKRVNVKQDQTKIRVSKGILAERLCYVGNGDYNIAISDDEALKIIAQLNVKRNELGFKDLQFWRFEENADKESS